MQDFKKKANDKMTQALEVFKKDLSTFRTGRASLGILDNIKVDYYGNVVPLNQVATLGIPEPRMITIQPWEQKMISEIERSIMKSDLGLTPINDGKMIKIVIPALTEERRKQLVKVVRKRAEEARVAVRNIRRDIIEEVKKSEKEKKISEDDSHRLQEEIQKITNAFIEKIDHLLEQKEKEIMEV
ncbi:MAG TPA: ribosome recycling factor [Thermodesulfovibrio thiophilus]|uniref:ribosome recycling factor n=1 Tax=Thermodesulfovibrio thiophilus TaxID=340095 RepID=UPI0017AD3A28|nr:ribosome recycling factor [Thermodesulfovibrio thiophilus]HHW19770.1 ribosome recycling factor [Thermodesulfovibrio thiophilus]HOA83488.1 ribosome recycling factor [Thermodesulfovibrio thiophilus]HQA04338.1 ribosome recycling factor [Thermodesulfovibrio thiophilus]HQD36664.1 ribosome recycling factor [Thermodesulfovibrio thiophilus]